MTDMDTPVSDIQRLQFHGAHTTFSPGNYIKDAGQVIDVEVIDGEANMGTLWGYVTFDGEERTRISWGHELLTEYQNYTPPEYKYDLATGKYRFFPAEYTNPTGTTAHTNGELAPMGPMRYTSVSVSKGILDVAWTATLEVEGHIAPLPANRHLTISMQDHNDVERVVFFGVIPALTHKYDRIKNSTTLHGYSMFYNLTRRFVERYLQSTLAYDENTEVTTYRSPEMWIRAQLDGTGIRPGSITPCGEWDNGTLTQKGFAFSTTTTRWNAAKEWADYISFMIGERWSTAPYEAYLNWESANAIDSLGVVPVPVVITNPDDYMIGDLVADERADEKFNFVTVRGFIGTLTECNSGHAGRMDLRFLAQYGSISVDLIENDHNGVWVPVTSLVDGVLEPGPYTVTETGTEEGGTTSIAVSYLYNTTTVQLQDSDRITVSYSPFESFYESFAKSGGVLAGTEDIRELEPVDVPCNLMVDAVLYADWNKDNIEEWITLQEYFDYMAQGILELCQVDPHVYTCSLRKRCDLKLYQKLQFMGYPNLAEYLPTETKWEKVNGTYQNVEYKYGTQPNWMRITKITYTQNADDVIVNVEMTPNKKLSMQNNLKRFMMLDQIDLIGSMIDQGLGELPVDKTGTVVKIAGTAAITKTRMGLYHEVEIV